MPANGAQDLAETQHPAADVAAGQAEGSTADGADATSARMERLAKRFHHRRIYEQHGMSSNGVVIPEYRVWVMMRDRCKNPKSPKWPRYGGRGIRVCERWEVFGNFIADMGRRPGPDFSIDRRDNDGNYEPSNCRWATRSQQARNQKRATRKAGRLP